MGLILFVEKLLFFTFNLLILFIGIFFLAIGIYARLETQRLGDISSAVSDPAIAIIILGIILALLGFIGGVGGLRELKYVLYVYIAVVGLFVILEIALVIGIFVAQSQIEQQADNAIKFLIREYRENADLRAAVDLFQNYLVCCGSQSFFDWDDNVYFNCNATGVERCGVPTSCCKVSQQLNSQCGFNVRDSSETSRLGNINQEGCISNFRALVVGNLYAVGGVGIGLLAVQIASILMGFAIIIEIKRGGKEDKVTFKNAPLRVRQSFRRHSLGRRQRQQL